jgi:hypothetical protein
LRQAILAADPAIVEGARWNGPDVRARADFATVHLRAKHGISLILHRGAKVRALSDMGLAADDRSGPLQWPVAFRAQARFTGVDDARGRGPALQALPRPSIAALHGMPSPDAGGTGRLRPPFAVRFRGRGACRGPLAPAAPHRPHSAPSPDRRCRTACP